MSPHELHADWLNKQKLMSETNTTTTRKTRVRKPNAPHITALKAAVSKALKNEWLLQQAITKQSKAAERAEAKVAKLTLEARESWYAVQVRCVDCANAHIV
jgi:hypothetical protein